jgi:GST-like protein
MSEQLYGVLDRRLAETEYLAGAAYSIADVATYPWTMPRQQEMHRIDISQYPNVRRWNETVAARPAVERGIAVLAEDMKVGNPTEEAYDNMFGSRQFEN